MDRFSRGIKYPTPLLAKLNHSGKKKSREVFRGFLLAGDAEFLEPYNRGREDFFEHLAAVKALVDDNPQQIRRLEAIEQVMTAWVREVSEPAVALRRAVDSGFKTRADVDAFVSRKTGKIYFDDFRQTIEAFKTIESDLMVERRKAADAERAAYKADIATMREADIWIDHTHMVIRRAMEILAAAVDTETGMRGYLLAGREAFLEPYNTGRESFFQLTTALKETVNDNPAQAKLLGEMEGAFREWLETVTEPTIALRRKTGFSKTMDDMADLIGGAHGKRFFDQFRKTMDDFEREETARKDRRQSRRRCRGGR